MTKQKLEEKFDEKIRKKIFAQISAKIFIGDTNKQVIDLIMEVINDNYLPKTEAIPKAEHKKILIEYLKSGSVKNCYNEEAIERIIDGLNSTN